MTIISNGVNDVRDLVQNPRNRAGINVNRTFADGHVPLVLAATIPQATWSSSEFCSMLGRTRSCVGMVTRLCMLLVR